MPRLAVPKRFMILFLLFAPAAAAGCAAGGSETGAGGYLHTYDMEVGKTLRFEGSTTTSVRSEMLEAVFSGPIEMQMPYTVRLEFEGQEGGRFTGGMIFEEVDIQGPEEMMGGLSGAMGDLELEGMRLPFTLEPGGRSEMEVAGEGTGMPFSRSGPVSQGLQQYFIPWPDRPLQVGATWTDTLRQEWEPEEGAGSRTRQVTRYTYQGLLLPAEGTEALHTVHASMEGSMVGIGSDEASGLEVTVTGSWTGETTYRFDALDGILEESEGSLAIDMTVDMGGAMAMSLPMEMITEFRTHRVR